MPLHATDHAWNTSYSLQEDHSIEPATLIEFFWIVARHEIKAHTRKTNHVKGDAIPDASWRFVRVLDRLGIFL